MNGKHWTDDELLDRLYGLGPEDDHLHECPECGTRWKALLETRSAVVRDVDVSPSRLLQQRLAVMERIERTSGSFFSLKAVATFSGAAAMMLGIWIFTPQRPNPAAIQSASSDTQFFSEIYSEVQQTEPRAVKPIHKLFQEHP